MQTKKKKKKKSKVVSVSLNAPWHKRIGASAKNLRPVKLLRCTISNRRTPKSNVNRWKIGKVNNQMRMKWNMRKDAKKKFKCTGNSTVSARVRTTSQNIWSQCTRCRPACVRSQCLPRSHDSTRPFSSCFQNQHTLCNTVCDQWFCVVCCFGWTSSHLKPTSI